MDTEKIGWALVEMGCGRKVAKDVLDNSAGINSIASITSHFKPA